MTTKVEKFELTDEKLKWNDNIYYFDTGKLEKKDKSHIREYQNAPVLRYDSYKARREGPYEVPNMPHINPPVQKLEKGVHLDAIYAGKPSRYHLIIVDNELVALPNHKFFDRLDNVKPRSIIRVLYEGQVPYKDGFYNKYRLWVGEKPKEEDRDKSVSLFSFKDKPRKRVKITLEGDIDEDTLDRLELLDKCDPEGAYQLQDFITDLHIIGGMWLQGLKKL